MGRYRCSKIFTRPRIAARTVYGHLRRVSAFALCLSVAAPLAAQVPQIVTQVQHAGRDLTIYANGVPVAQAPGDMSSHMFQIGSFLVDGENTIKFEWTRRQAPGMVFSAVVQENRPPEGLTDLARVEEISDDPVGQVSSRTVTVRIAMPRPWLWEQAPSLSLSRSDRAAITTKVRELHEAFANGDVSRILEMTEVMWTEMAGFRDGIIDRIRTRYAELMASPDWSVEPLDVTTLRIEAFGPLVRVLGDGALIQQSQAPGRDARINVNGLFFAQIDGEWIPVRPAS